jgi:DNA-binding transcriptional regulator YiaG
MASMVPVLNEHIRRLARREVRAASAAAMGAAAHYRREVAALKHRIRELEQRVEMLERGRGVGLGAVSFPENARFRADGLRSHRARMGISAQDYGRLVGVSGLTVYNWESGKSKPRRRQFARLLEVRGLGKREALRRLAQLSGRGVGK